MHSDLLNSWKEIADYLGRSIRTVQRWEAQLHLPVRRPHLRSRSSVTALKSDLDQWIRNAGQSANGTRIALVDIKQTAAILEFNRQEMLTLSMRVRYQLQQTRALVKRARELSSQIKVIEPALAQVPATEAELIGYAPAKVPHVSNFK